jgi:hypothetical protein
MVLFDCGYEILVYEIKKASSENPVGKIFRRGLNRTCSINRVPASYLSQFWFLKTKTGRI